MKITDITVFEDNEYLDENEIEINSVDIIAGPHDDDPISCIRITLHDPERNFDGDEIVFNKTSSGFEVEAAESTIVRLDVTDATHVTMHFGNISDYLGIIELWLVHDRAATPKLHAS